MGSVLSVTVSGQVMVGYINLSTFTEYTANLPHKPPRSGDEPLPLPSFWLNKLCCGSFKVTVIHGKHGDIKCILAA